MRYTILLVALISTSAAAQDVRVWPPGPARVWGQKMPAECTPVTTWPLADYPATYPVGVYPPGCGLPWLANFARFWNWASSDKPEPK